MLILKSGYKNTTPIIWVLSKKTQIHLNVITVYTIDEYKWAIANRKYNIKINQNDTSKLLPLSLRVFNLQTHFCFVLKITSPARRKKALWFEKGCKLSDLHFVMKGCINGSRRTNQIVGLKLFCYWLHLLIIRLSIVIFLKLFVALYRLILNELMAKYAIWTIN